MGEGHMSPAKAVQQALDFLYPKQYKTEIIDFVSLVNKTLNNVTYKALYNSVKHAPYLYKLVYKQFDKKNQIKILNLIQYPLLYKKIKNFLSQKNADLILSVYPLWDYNIVKINNKNSQPIPFISLITDSIKVHNAWVTAEADYHLVTNKDTAESLLKMDVNKDKIKVFGLPLRLEFLQETDRPKIMQKLKLDQKKPLLIFLATAENNKNISRQLKEILQNHPDKNLVIITGNNHKAYKKIKELKLPKNVKLKAFCKNMHELLKSANIVIGKAGGSIVQECIACQTPIILTQVIPGHEEGNALFIKKYKLGIDLTQEKTSLSEAISTIIKSEKSYKERLKKQSRPDAALKVADFINSLLV